jgi:hypothetical protein
MKVQYLRIEHINLMWPVIEPFIRKVSEMPGSEYTADQYKLRLIDGTWQALIFVDDNGVIHGVIVVCFYNRPNSRVGFIVCVGGKLIINHETWEQVRAYMRQNGATVMEGNVRKSVARLWKRLGGREKYSVVGEKL